MISQELTAALDARRAELNARFRAVGTLHSHLNRERFMSFVRDCMDPLIVKIHRQVPEAVHAVVAAAYDAGLQLIAARATEEPEQRDLIRLAWREALPAKPHFVAANPTQIIASVNNALLQIAAVDKGAAANWLRELIRMSAHCESSDEFLNCGQVLAWTSGLAHFRSGALELLQAMRDPLVQAIFDVEQPASELRAQLHGSRWFSPRHRVGSVDVLSKVGAFRGFGGTFLEPPSAAAHADGWVIRSGSEHWYLIADAFGHSLHRATAEEWQHAERTSTRSRAQFAGTRLLDAKLDIADAGAITSAAAWDGAIACTTALSHQVIIVAPQ